MTVAIAWLSGLLFGLGLILAGMSDPAQVLGFLDLAGPWNPSLAFVMGGAVVFVGVVHRLTRGWQKSCLGLPLQWPTGRGIDRRLLFGSAIFGVGWGMSGICPGPGFVLLGMGSDKGLVFVAAMLAGMAIYEARNFR